MAASRPVERCSDGCMNILRRVSPSIVLTSLLITAPPAIAGQTIASVTRPTPLSTFGGRILWSSYDAAFGRYFLTTSEGGTTARLPVASRVVPFDADLGPGPSGGVVAVYSRCRHAPERRPGFAGNALAQLPEWETGRGCDLYEYDFATRHEKRLGRASSPHASEFLPTVSKNRIVFARVYEERRGPAGRRAYLYERPLTGKGSTRRLPAGARSTGRFCSGKPIRCRPVLEPGPTVLDLQGKRLVIGWDSADELGPTSSAYLVTLGKRPTRKRIFIAASGDIQGVEVVGTALASGYAWSGVTLFGDTTENELRRFNLARASQTTAFARESPFGSALAVVVDGSQVFYLHSGASPYPGCSQKAPCELRAAPLPTFNGSG
jgi:hypothetical protein